MSHVGSTNPERAHSKRSNIPCSLLYFNLTSWPQAFYPILLWVFTNWQRNMLCNNSATWSVSSRIRRGKIHHSASNWKSDKPIHLTSDILYRHFEMRWIKRCKRNGKKRFWRGMLLVIYYNNKKPSGWKVLSFCNPIKTLSNSKLSIHNGTLAFNL